MSFDQIEEPQKQHASASVQIQLRQLEEEFFAKVNYVISHKVTPVYNTYLVIVVAIFAYYTIIE